MGDEVLDELPAATYDLATLLDAWEGSLRAVVGLGRALSPAQWEAPTECPGWSAGDVVRHLCWVESFLANRADAPHEVDWAAHPHATSDFGRLTETDNFPEAAGRVDMRLGAWAWMAREAELASAQGPDVQAGLDDATALMIALIGLYYLGSGI